MRHVGENEVKFQLENSTGPMGPAGPIGPQGIQGPRGATGPAGATGARGEKGERGEKGDRGDTGLTGATGPAGAAGPQGERGPKGDPGETGATGPQGPAGPQGPKGDKGDKGDTGATGPQGPQGPAGPQGEKGDPGDSGYVLPTAAPDTLGGVKPAAKTDEMTQAVGVDELGGLWALPGGACEWRLIKSLTVPATAAEGAAGVNWADMSAGGVIFGFDTDENGNPFSVTELAMEVVAGAAGVTAPMTLGVTSSTPVYFNEHTPFGAHNWPNNNRHRGFSMNFRVAGNMFMDLYGFVSGAEYGTANLSTKLHSYKSSPITKIRCGLNWKADNGFYQGSTFKFYGR